MVLELASSDKKIEEKKVHISLSCKVQRLSQNSRRHEQKNINRAENHARSAIISWSMSLQTTDTNYYDAERDK